MIKIFCLYYEGKYTKDYVDKLYRGIKRNCKVPFRFYAYSDTPVMCDHMIMLRDTLPGHWHKIKFFDKKFTGEGDIIVMDIDQVIVGDITEMIEYPVGNNELVSYDKWWTDDRATTINGGWYKFKAGDFQCVWDKYIENPDKWSNHYFETGVVHYRLFGEQNFVEDTIRENGGKVTTMPGEWVCKLTHDEDNNEKIQRRYVKKFGEHYLILGDEFNPKVKIVHFANPNNDVHNSKHKWLKDFWK